MIQMKRTLARLVLVLPLLWGATQAAAKNAAQPVGRIAMEGTSIAAGVGVNWGDGTLRFQGQNYKFSVSGLSLVKPARNSGRDAPPPFVDDLLDVSERSMLPMVVQKEHLIEPHTGDDKGTGAR
jgi:hypothetical protein